MSREYIAIGMANTKKFYLISKISMFIIKIVFLILSTLKAKRKGTKKINKK